MLARTPAKERRLQEIMAQAVRTIAYWPSPEQDDMQAANMRKAAKEALKAWSAEASRCEHLMQESRVGVAGFSAKCLHCGAVLANTFQKATP